MAFLKSCQSGAKVFVASHHCIHARASTSTAINATSNLSSSGSCLNRNNAQFFQSNQLHFRHLKAAITPCDALFLILYECIYSQFQVRHPHPQNCFPLHRSMFWSFKSLLGPQNECLHCFKNICLHRIHYHSISSGRYSIMVEFIPLWLSFWSCAR